MQRQTLGTLFSIRQYGEQLPTSVAPHFKELVDQLITAEEARLAGDARRAAKYRARHSDAPRPGRR